MARKKKNEEVEKKKQNDRKKMSQPEKKTEEEKEKEKEEEEESLGHRDLRLLNCCSRRKKEEEEEESPITRAPSHNTIKAECARNLMENILLTPKIGAIVSWLANMPWDQFLTILLAMEGATTLLPGAVEAKSTAGAIVEFLGFDVAGSIYMVVEYLLLFIRYLGIVASVVKLLAHALLKRAELYLDVVRVSHNFFAVGEQGEYFDFQSVSGDIATKDFFTKFVNDVEFMIMLLEKIRTADEHARNTNKLATAEENKIPTQLGIAGTKVAKYVVIKLSQNIKKEKEMLNRTQQKTMELFGVDWLRESTAKREVLVCAFVYEADPSGGAKKVRLMTIRESDLEKCQKWMREGKGVGGGTGNNINDWKKRTSRWNAIKEVFVKSWLPETGKARDDQGGLFHIEVPRRCE